MAELEGVLGSLRRGQAAVEFEDALRELLEAVQETGKQGSLTVTLKVGLYDRNDSATLEITDDIKIKLPTLPKGKSLMYRDAETGLLTRRDPRQPSLPGTGDDEESQPAGNVARLPNRQEGNGQ